MTDYISVADVRAAESRNARPIIVDVRSPEEYQAGHLPDAVPIPLAELPDRVSDLPTDRPVVTYCNMQHRGASRSERAAQLLRERGIQAQALEGGFPAWKAAGYPVEGDQSAQEPRP